MWIGTKCVKLNVSAHLGCACCSSAYNCFHSQPTIAFIASLQTAFFFCAHKSFKFTGKCKFILGVMPRVYLMTFELTGNTCALLLARAVGMVVASSPAHARYQARTVTMCNNSFLRLITAFGHLDVATMRPLAPPKHLE